MEKNVLNENAIIQRLSDDQMSMIYGGHSQEKWGIITDPIQTKCSQPTDPLCNCLAGCGCGPIQIACDKCIADI